MPCHSYVLTSLNKSDFLIYNLLFTCRVSMVQRGQESVLSNRIVYKCSVCSSCPNAWAVVGLAKSCQNAMRESWIDATQILVLASSLCSFQCLCKLEKIQPYLAWPEFKELVFRSKQLYHCQQSTLGLV